MDESLDRTGDAHHTLKDISSPMQTSLKFLNDTKGSTFTEDPNASYANSLGPDLSTCGGDRNGMQQNKMSWNRPYVKMHITRLKCVFIANRNRNRCGQFVQFEGETPPVRD
eukprot:5015217-Pleurochrysis_carterae.AAC.1